MSATRLSQTESTVATVLDEYVKSVAPIQIMIKYSNMLPENWASPVLQSLAKERRSFCRSSLLTVRLFLFPFDMDPFRCLLLMICGFITRLLPPRKKCVCRIYGIRSPCGKKGNQKNGNRCFVCTDIGSWRLTTR